MTCCLRLPVCRAAAAAAWLGMALFPGEPTLSAQTRPSAPSDSIVRLAVDTARVRGVPFVALLDERRYRVEADGRSATTLRQVVQVLDANAARGAAERAIGYHGGMQELTLHWVRVLRPNGEVLSDSVAQSQDAEVPVSMSAPIYTGQRLRRLSLAGVSAGVIIDMSYTITQRTPPRPGDVFARWTQSGPAPVRQSIFEVDAPTTMPLRVIERNLTTRRTERDSAGRRVFRWTLNDPPPLRAEPFAADSNDVVPSVVVGPAGDWTPVARWYDALARARYTLTPDVLERADSVLRAAGARTRLDSVRAWHRWVAQDVRYVSISLGLGGYQPRSPDEVLQSGVGDCKDKTTLFVALLRHAGIKAEPVLLSTAGRPLADVPSVLQFNHAIAAVPERGGWQFTDLTADLVPFGELPVSFQGAFALQVAGDGSARPTTIPVAPAGSHGTSTRMQVVVDSLGHAEGTSEETARGNMALAMRAVMAAAPDSARRDGLMRGMAQRIGGGVLDNVRITGLEGFDGRDLSATPQLRYRVQYERAVRSVGNTIVLQVPPPLRGPARQFAGAVRSLESAPSRRMPIDASRLLPPNESLIEWQVTLPEGWTAELPAAVRAVSFFGSYESSWSQSGRVVTLRRRILGTPGTFPPERMPEVLVWLRAVGADDVEFVTIRSAR
jgi:transglutaminase-like putative cysteine protease